jgi:hypothetical protein
MSFNFNPPNVNASTEKEQIQQIKSYLFQLTDQLNWAFTTLENQRAELKKSVDETKKK